MPPSSASSAALGSMRPTSTCRLKSGHLTFRPHQHQKSLHTTPSYNARHKSPYRSISKAELDRIEAARGRLISKYTKEELDEMKAKYTPEQFASIAAAEEAVDLKDLAKSNPRQDALRPRRTEPSGYSRIHPVVDKRIERIRGEWDNAGDNSKYEKADFLPDAEKKMQRLFEIMVDPSFNPNDALDKRRHILSEAERRGKAPPPPPGANDPADPEALIGKLWHNGLPGDTSTKIRTVDMDNDPNALETAIDRMTRELADVPQGWTPELSTRERLEKALKWRDESSPEVAPELPMINDPKVRWEGSAEAEAAEESGGADDDTIEALARLSKATGQPVERLRSYSTKILVSHRVVNQTRLGKIGSEYCLAVAGDGRGSVGIGEGKAAEAPVASRTATLNAIRNMRPVRRYEDRTIYGELYAKVGATEVTLGARPPGFGLRVSGRVFEIARAAGIYDLSARVTRSRNPMNVAKAVWQALCSQRDPEDIARARGRKLVDVRKVYYAGLQ